MQGLGLGVARFLCFNNFNINSFNINNTNININNNINNININIIMANNINCMFLQIEPWLSPGRP